jgi:hypothetical protein
MNTYVLFAQRLPGRLVRLGRLAAAVVLLVGAGMAPAANILVNPGFEANISGHAVAEGWTRFAPPSAQPFGNYWIEPPAHSGALSWKQWGASYLPPPTNNVAGIYQDFSSAPGSVYEAGGWSFTKGTDTLGADCRTWLEVSFLDAEGDALALYTSDAFTAAAGTDTWRQYAVTNACDLSAPIDTGDPYFTAYAVTGTVSQLIAPVGTATVRFLYAYLQAGSQGGSAYFDDAVLDQVSGPLPPVITDLFPRNMIFVDPADGVTFQVSSPSGFAINEDGIHLTLNGVDVSGDLVVEGSATDRSVAYHGLESNTTYTASVSATDSFGFSVAADTYFETTWVGIDPIVYLWEAEDYDFGGGMYINDPELCSVAGDPDCYFGKVAVVGVDVQGSSAGGLYRPDDPIGTAVSGDYLRKNLYLAGRLDYKLDPFIFGDWVNYTRDWPAGTYWMVGRLATEIGFSGSLTLSRVEAGGSTTDLGEFTIDSGRGWSTFDNVYLKDADGFPVNVTLDGTETLRLTSNGNLLPGCFMLVEAIVDMPRLSNLYPTGRRPFEYTNALSFTVATIGATFPPGGIRVNLDGRDITADLAITGTGGTQTVAYADLRPNAVHTAVITVTNSLDHGFSLTNRFDTFSQDNDMVEAEDFDYGGGQFIEDWFPEAYGFWNGPYIALTNADYHHTPFEEEEYLYRDNGIPEDLTRDWLRDKFVTVGAFDYDLTWFAPGDWCQYTRDYPAGDFHVYGRFSGLGDSVMYLDRVVSGVGTTNQVTTRLGVWATAGRAYDLYDWVPLQNEALSAPAVVTLDGRATLRITTGGSINPNFFMLVPAPAEGMRLTVGRDGGDVVLSLPTQPGEMHPVYSRDSMTEGSWNLLTTVPGDGTVKSVHDPATAPERFYRAE